MRLLASLLFAYSLAYVEAQEGITKPLVEPEQLEALVNREALLGHAHEFLKFSKLSNGTRAFGSEGHRATLQYIKDLLDATDYYDVELETFTYSYSEAKAQFFANGKEYLTRGVGYSPSGDVTGPLVVVNDLGCNAADFPAEVEGKVALVLRGTCELGLKVAHAGAAGAIGTVIYNNLDAAPISGTLGSPSRPQGPYVPTAYISGLDGKAFIADINAGSEVSVNIKVQSFTEDRETSNVIATTKLGDRDNVIVAGAHSDSVPAGPGLNDDGSGSMGILEVALNLPKFSVNNAVRFIWWTAEEFGLIGSEYHVEHLSEEARQKIAIYLNFDMIASPNGGYFIFDGDGNETNLPGAPGSKAIEDMYRAYFDMHSIRVGPAGFTGGSDYQPFVDIGVPAGGLHTGTSPSKTEQGAEWWGGQAGVAYDVCYHLACDVIENLNVEMWERNSKAIGWSIATYARSIEGIPRGPRKPVKSLRVSKLTYDERLHLSCEHNEDVI